MFVSTSILAITVLVATLFILYRWRHRKFYEVFNKIPSVEYSLFGLTRMFLKTDAKSLYKSMETFTSAGPSPRRVCLVQNFFVIVDDPEQLQKVFNSRKCIDKTPSNKQFVMKTGLLTDDGPVWRPHRKALEPAFNSAIIKSFLSIFNEKTKVCMAKLEEKVGKPQFNVLDTWERLALDNILTTSLGINKNIQLEKNCEYLSNVVESLKIFGIKVLNPLHTFDFIHRRTKLYQLEQKHATNGFLKFGDDIAKKKQKEFSETKVDIVQSEDLPKTPQIFIDQLFKLEGAFTPSEITDEVNTIILAGFETVSKSLSSIVLLLAFHPDIQDKLFEELQNVFATADEEVTDEHLKQLTYMDLVIKESLRFWSPVPLLARYVTQEIELGGYTIPSSVNLLIPAVHIHRNKTHWGEDADEFKPERFEPENFKKVHLYAYMPFSKGLRNCVGYNYAISSLKVVLAHFFRRFKTSTTLKLEEIEFEYAVLAKVAQGYMITLTKRDFIE